MIYVSVKSVIGCSDLIYTGKLWLRNMISKLICYFWHICHLDYLWTPLINKEISRVQGFWFKLTFQHCSHSKIIPSDFITTDSVVCFACFTRESVIWSLLITGWFLSLKVVFSVDLKVFICDYKGILIPWIIVSSAIFYILFPHRLYLMLSAYYLALTLVSVQRWRLALSKGLTRVGTVHSSLYQIMETEPVSKMFHVFLTNN